jgi:hypothetical protein
VVNVATPELSVAVPRTAPLLRKETVPVAVPEAALTAAVRVTDWPAVIVEGDARSEVVVWAAGAALTVSVMGEEVEALKLLVPVYWAVSESVP